MDSTNRSLTPILAIVLSVLVVALTVFVISQRGGEVDGGYGTPAYPEIDAPERLTEEDVTSQEATAEPLPAPLPTTDDLDVPDDADQVGEESDYDTVRD